MNNIFKTNSHLIFCGFLLLSSALIRGQENQNSAGQLFSDSLSLKWVIKETLNNHPTVKSAEEALKIADARIGLAKTGYYPLIDMTASLANIGPVIKLTIPSMGTFQLYPENSYSASINYRQVVYDFGRTRQNLEIEEESKLIGENTLEQVKQRMSLAVVNNFYTIAYLQEAVRIKDEQLGTLGAHLKYVETMKATGSATDYQILSTKVKISTAESQKVDLLASLDIQQTYLRALLGKDDLKPVVKEELHITSPITNRDSLLSYAFLNRDEMLINQEKASLAGLKYQLIKSLNRPLISFVASGGAKNGYIPNLEAIKPNYSVGIGISVPLFDGMKTKYNLLQAESAISLANLETENTKRNITSEVREAEAYIVSAYQKVSQFSLQLEQAIKAYSLAETSFRAGTVTNLELLDTNTTVSESRLMLLKARIDYAASIYRYKAVLGEKLY
jgi:outer membrane protein TolC